MNRHHETIDALLDGERVDIVELKEALAEAAGRDYLVDALALRELVAETTPVATRITSPVVPAWQRRVWWPAAAAILVASLLAGFAAGYRSAGSVAAEVPVRHDAPAVAGKVNASPPLSAPTPTRVIRLEPGVDWTEGAGGN